MKKINPIISILIVMLALCSCNDDDDSTTYPVFVPPSADRFTALHTIAQNNLKQEFSFNADDGPVTFTSLNGVVISLNSTCLTKNSQPVTGEIKLEFKEVYKRGNMLTANTPTMGNMGNGDLSLLISGGEFYINATQNGDQLEYNCNYQLTIPGALTGGTDNTMTLWDGIFNGNDLIWNENEGGQENGVFAEGGNYNLFNDEFGWTNVDRFYSDPRPKTTLSVTVPVGYNSTNCSVYLSYVGEPNALAFLDTYDPVTGTFSEHYGQIPVGLECHVIFVSEMAGQWVYAIEDETIEANETIDIELDDLYSTSEANLITLINNLP